jgi:hypothetical protein
MQDHDSPVVVVAGAQRLPLAFFAEKSRGQGIPSHDSDETRKSMPWENPMAFFLP